MAKVTDFKLRRHAHTVNPDTLTSESLFQKVVMVTEH